MTDEREPEPGFREAFADAMRKTGLGQVAPGEVPTGRSLLKAVGGLRGLVESILPALAFLVLYATTKNLPLSVLVPVALAVVFVVVRLVTRTPITQAFAGIVGIAISAILALVSGRPEANFLPGIVVNSVSLAVLLVSILARWPLIGVIVGFLTNETTQWREQKAKRRVLYLTTWLWAGLFALRLAVEVPLYLAQQAEWLAGAKLLLGIPLYAGMLWVTWLLVRAVYSGIPRPISE
ncbi:DUF3159 domain-containing protein [Frigoribacterium sp. CG_9.8]|uniref:DUF3159 domain-containing protein n=1 Tax=Frigoribacterium sp. CG_9.8 TaxID=2787733 RepID=UPI001A27F24A|nr:hypothetical protein [Frigoribacterium sp. CG_9.8]